MSEATGKLCTRCGAVLDVHTAVAMQDEIEVPDERFSMLLQDITEKMVELGIK